MFFVSAPSIYSLNHLFRERQGGLYITNVVHRCFIRKYTTLERGIIIGLFFFGEFVGILEQLAGAAKCTHYQPHAKSDEWNAQQPVSYTHLDVYKRQSRNNAITP